VKRTVARRPAAGLTLLAGSVAAGSALAALVLNARVGTGPLHRSDVSTAGRLNRSFARRSRQIRFWKAISAVGSPTSWRLLAAIAAVMLWLRHRRQPAVRIAGTMAGAAILSAGTKVLVGRPRPVVALIVGRASGKSFPSGHALTSLVAAGRLVLLLWPASSTRQRLGLLAAAAVVVAAIGFSRLVLGVHFLSDVLGGWLIGGLWLLASRRLLRRRPVARRS
jgi:membrane-associated phospholipid phosphatase